MTLTRTAKARRRAAQRLAALQSVCARKQPLPGKIAAQIKAAQHHPCRRCDEGYRLTGYQCPADPRHWHVGHMLWWTTAWVS